jgi:preprotein translocase subunit SecD
MNQGLGWKISVIVATLALFLYGIVGIPANWSGRGLLRAVERRIHLGLDLEGGTHLVLQVQVNDAFGFLPALQAKHVTGCGASASLSTVLS